VGASEERHIGSCISVPVRRKETALINSSFCAGSASRFNPSVSSIDPGTALSARIPDRPPFQGNVLHHLAPGEKLSAN
jgi:hypothetical protein